MSVQVGTEMRVICGDCNHSQANHHTTETRGGHPRCCFGWCPCALRKPVVAEQNAPQERPIFGGFDEESDRWVS